jgi:hypothetical protein
VVVSSAAFATECFTENDVCFANRPRFPMLLLVSFGGATLPMCRYGPFWRNIRRVATVQLLSAHRVSCMRWRGGCIAPPPPPAPRGSS